MRRLPEWLFSLVAAALVGNHLFWKYRDFAAAPGMDWNSSEWMISYAGGFVRRGLGGAAIARLMDYTGAGFFTAWISLSLFFFACFFLYFLKSVSALRVSGFWRFALYFSPLLILFPVEVGSFLRKDVVFICATIASIEMTRRALTGEAAGKRAFYLFAALPALSLLGVALALLHEGIALFFWIPVNGLIVYQGTSRFIACRTRRLRLALLVFLPALAAVAASVHWHGTAQTAEAICRGWYQSGTPTLCDTPEDLPPAVGALGWSAGGEMLGALHYIRLGWPLAYGLAAAFLAALQIAVIRKDDGGADVRDLAAAYLVPALLCLPSFLIGTDWGRWLFLLLTQSFLLTLHRELRPAAYEFAKLARADRLEAPWRALADRLGAFAGLAERRQGAIALAFLAVWIPATPDIAYMTSSSPARQGSPLFMAAKLFRHALRSTEASAP